LSARSSTATQQQLHEDRDCTFEALERKLRERREKGYLPSYFLFSGHANVVGDGQPDQKRLGFTTPDGRFAPGVETMRVAELFRQHSKGHGGGLELLVLNGCESAELARACVQLGVPFVACWRTIVHDEAAYLFARGLFRALSASTHSSSSMIDRYRSAFEAGKAAVVSEKRIVRKDDGDTEVPYFELQDPSQRPLLLPSGSFTAGVPMLVWAEGSEVCEVL
jgi:hypothetical protein